MGFLVTAKGVRLTSTFLNSIRSFPTHHITDICSWFGAINQIVFATTPIMAPSTNSSQQRCHECDPRNSRGFWSLWGDNLTVQEGDMELWPLFTHSSGYRLGQAGHRLLADTEALQLPWGTLPWLLPLRPSWWQTIYCSSRFCSPAELHYKSIEGEALASVVGLEKCIFFIRSLPDLILCLDLKPLLTILGDRHQVMNIPYPKHVPRKQNVTLCLDVQIHPYPPNGSSKSTPARKHVWCWPKLIFLPTKNLFGGQQQHPARGFRHGAYGVHDGGRSLCTAALTSFQPSPNEAKLSAEDRLMTPTWDKLGAACLTGSQYKMLHSAVTRGVSDTGGLGQTDKGVLPQSPLPEQWALSGQ